ncbi:sialin-like [Periplaneta americana]|uniref:sialin-like n=1 Tax=Periplaneta americana TaxID=6978 RepID=UPI0037E9437C
MSTIMMLQHDLQSSPKNYSVERVKKEQQKDSWLCNIPSRYVLAALGFAGCAVQFTLNVCLSVAIVAMVKPVESSSQDRIILKTNGNITFTENLDEDVTVCPSPHINENLTYSTSAYNQTGEFSWDEETQGHVLSAYYYGYVITQLIGGRLSEIFGGKMVYGPGIAFSGILCLFTPVAARANFYAFIIVRVLTGAASGVAIPALHAMFANWFPPSERAKISGVIFSATNVGSLLSTCLSGMIVEYGGWPLVFYFFGSVTVMWFIPWMLLVYNSPYHHPRISQEEKNYIVSELKASTDEEIDPVPWFDILTSGPVWAAIGMSCSTTWITFTFLTELPTYTKNILHFDIAQSGIISSLPYLSTWISSIACGFLSQWLTEKGYMSQLSAYHIFNGIASCGPALSLLTITLVGCNTTIIVILLVLTLATRGAYFGGSYINHVDIGHNYAGTISGIMLTLSNSAGVFSPLVTGYLTQGQQNLQQWRYVFYISIVIVIVPYIIYVFYGSVDEQPWNRPKQSKKSCLNETTIITHM